MKKLLIGLVLAMVLSVCAFAVSPAVNVLTGTKDALNFENAENDYFYNSNTSTASYFTFGVQNDETGGGRGKVYAVVSDMDKIAAEKGDDTYLYYTLAKDLTDVPDRPVYLVFETYGKKNIGFWLGNSAPITIGALSADNTWIKNVYNNVSVFGGGPNVLKIQYATRSLDCNDVQYFDNIALYPYYKIDYVLEYPDGTNGATTTKYFFDASNLTVAKDGTVSGFPTSYTLESVIASYPGYNFLGWTTQKGGSTAVTSVSLSNSDITLYPIWEKKAYVSPVNVTVYLDEAKTQKLNDVYSAGDLYKLPTYEELVQYTKAGKMPSGFRMNGKLYAPGKSVMLPEEDNVVFTAEYASTLHEEYGELIMLENFDLLENGTYICDAEKSESYPINPAYINPSWSTNKAYFQLRYGDSMNNLQVMDVDGNNMLKVTKVKASSMWPQFYIFNNGGTPDGLYTVVANYVIPKSELSHLSNINVRVYYSGKASGNVQTTVSSLAGSDAGLSVACSVAAAAGTDITAIPKIQFFATADSTEYKTSYYADSIAIYRKSAVANFKLSDSKTHKIFFTPGDEITLPRSYEIMDSIPEGYVLKCFKLGGAMYYEGQKYTTKSTDSVIDFDVVYEKRTYALKFETGKANGTIGEIEMLDGEKVNLPENGLYHPSLSLTGWKLKGSNKEFSKGEEFTLDADAFAKYFDGTDRLVFVPVFSGADFAVYGFEKDVVVPTGTPTLGTLVNVADSLYYGVRKGVSQGKTDAERLSDMASKGICPEYASLSKKATFGDAAVVLANALPESYYRELCFNVDINGGDEALKLVRAGIFDESTDFTDEISYAQLCEAVEKLTDSTKRSVENKRTFYVLGDSLTEAYGPSSSTKGWPEFIENYFTGNMALTNYGIAGINTGTYFNSAHVRAPGYYNKMITSVRRGDYVVIALGTNDSTLWGQGNMTKDQSRANYYRLISEIKAQGGIPVLVGPVGRNETDEDGNYKESDPDIIPVMQSVNEIYGVNVPIIDFKQVSFDRLSAMTAAERGEFYIDTVHYKAKGADMVAGWFEELVLAADEVQLEAFKYHFGKYTDEEPARYITYVMMNVGADETERNITWYSNTNDNSYVLYGKSGQTQFERADAVCTESVTEGYYSCKATLTGLEAGEWVYKLVTGSTTSDTYSFNVYNTQNGYSFAFIADAQVQTANHKTSWSDTVNKLMTKFSDVSFMVSAGDQITTNNSEEQYGYFITPELAKIATATTVGETHDDHAMYTSHFNLPNLSTEYGVSAASSNYYYRYPDTLFIHINVDNTEYAKHLEYITKIVGENPDCTWKIVVIHYSFFSGGDHCGDYYGAKFCANLAKGMADLGIDLVLSGHDHVYARSNLMLDGTTVSSDVVTSGTVTDPKGTLYLCGTSASGSKFYDVYKEEYADYIAYRDESNRKGATVFDVTDTTLTMNSYFLDGAEPELMDTFTIVKETEIAPEYDLVVTVDGIVKNYSDVTNFWTVLAEYADAAYAGKKVEFKLLDDLVFTSAGNLKPATGCSYSIDLAGHTLTESANARIYLQRKDFAINIYSSKKGGEFIFANSSDCFQPDVGCSIVFGSEQYKDTLTVSANNYFINMSAIANGHVMEVKFLNCTVNCGGFGFLRLNALGGGVATLKVEVTGCDVNGSTSLVFYNSSTSLSADKNGGVFSKDSYINCTDSSFTRTSTNPKNFFDSASTNITDRYFGTVNFDNCSFDTYIINGDVLYSDEALSYNTYYSTLTDYDPAKTVTIGEGCVFTNYGTTFNSAVDDFTANNVNLAKNCKLVSEESSVKVVLDNTVTIDIGARSADTNVRFVEINGVQKQIADINTYSVEIGKKNLLVEITEKTSEGEFVKSQYFHVDMAEKTYTKLSMDSFMTTDGQKSIRTKEPMGIRFKYSALKSAKLEEEAFIIDEIGFIIAVTDNLGDTELTLDFSKYVTGVAYNKAENKDIVFDRSDDIDVFTCVVKNIPVSKYKTNLTCKTYTKMTVGGEQFVVYGEPTTGNIYETAQKLLETDPDNADLVKIVLDADYSIGIDVGGLYD